MKKFFTKLKDWLKRHKPSKRRLIQVYAALLYNANIKGFISGKIYKGATKNMCVPGLNCYSCPGAVGACPLGALQNALSKSGTTAPFYVIGILLLMGLIFGRTICGFLCPVGLGQELLYKIKTPKLKKSRYTRIASWLKYIILVVMVIAIPISFGLSGFEGVPAFCKYICPAGTFGGGVLAVINPSRASDLASLGSLFTWKFAVFVVIAIASIFIFRFFCRFFCPLGALYGLFSKIALLGVKLDKNKCTDCGLCLNVCKMDIKRVGDHECIQCGECISACPAKAISWKGSKLFVHRNAVELAPPSEEKPLASLLTTEKTESAPAVAANVAAPVTEAAAPDAEQAASVESAAETAARREKKRKFWLQFAAWAAALALLIGALVYYNFIDVDPQKGVGEPVPEFTAERYDGETFSYEELEGSLSVIYFWEEKDAAKVEKLITDAAQVTEKIQKSYGSELSIKVVTISTVEEDKFNALSSQYEWDDKAIFLKDTDEEIRNLFVRENNASYSLTALLDRESLIQYTSESGYTTGELYRNFNETYTGKNAGDWCPDFTVQLLSEEGTYTFSERQSKVTIINFWATWCGPCVAELPEFNRLQTEYDYSDLQIIAIDVETAENEEVVQYINKQWSGYEIVFAKDEMVNSLGVVKGLLSDSDGLPVTLVVDQNGKILLNNVGGVTYESLKEQVETALKA